MHGCGHGRGYSWSSSSDAGGLCLRCAWPRPGASAHLGVCVRCILAADGLTPVVSYLELGTIRPLRSFPARSRGRVCG